MPPFPTRDRRCLGGHWSLLGLGRGGSGSSISASLSSRPAVLGSPVRKTFKKDNIELDTDAHEMCTV